MLNMPQKRLHFVNITIGVHWTVITCYFMVLQNDKTEAFEDVETESIYLDHLCNILGQRDSFSYITGSSFLTT